MAILAVVDMVVQVTDVGVVLVLWYVTVVSTS